MKPRTSPTSPKASADETSDIEKLYGTQLKSFDRPRLAPRPSVVWLIMILIIGFVAGIVGQLSLIWFSDELPFLEQLGFSRSDNTSVVLTSRNKDRILTAEQVEAIGQDLDHTIVSLYATRPADNAIENQYISNEKVGEGFVLTEDGFVVTQGNVIEEGKSYVAVGFDRSVYAVTSVMRDSATPYAIIKLDAVNLSTVAFSDIESIRNTEEVIVLSRDTGSHLPRILKLPIQQSRYFSVLAGSDLLLNSDIYQSRVLLGGLPDNSFEYGVAFTLDKKALGLVSRNDESYVITPFSHLTNILESSFADGRIVRPQFGVNYIMLDMLTDGNKLGMEIGQGALIYSTENDAGIVDGSVAEKAGLKTDDIITEIDGNPVSLTRTLSEVLLSHKVGDTITITIVRAGAEQKINLTIE